MPSEHHTKEVTMLVLRSFNNKVLVRGESTAELGEAMLRRKKKCPIRHFRVKKDIATWEYLWYGDWWPTRGYVEPEEYTPEQIRAILADLDFEGWAFTLDLETRKVPIMRAVPTAGPDFPTAEVILHADASKRQIVQAAYELIREAMYVALVRPVVAAWGDQCASNFRYRGNAIFAECSNRDLLTLLGPRASTSRFQPRLRAPARSISPAIQPSIGSAAPMIGSCDSAIGPE
jgi:hypothetical protein